MKSQLYAFYFRFICSEEFEKAKFTWKKDYKVSFYKKQNKN